MSKRTDESYLLDTVGASALIRQNPAILEVLNPDALVYLSIISLAELRFGALNSQMPERQMARVEALAETTILLGCDYTTAQLFAEIKIDLSRRGRMIPVNDIWIASIARQYNQPLVTVDAHFNEISSVRIITW